MYIIQDQKSDKFQQNKQRVHPFTVEIEAGQTYRKYKVTFLIKTSNTTLLIRTQFKQKRKNVQQFRYHCNITHTTYIAYRVSSPLPG